MKPKRKAVKDIDIGYMFGYKMILKDVDANVHQSIKALAENHLERMNHAYLKTLYTADHLMEAFSISKGKK